MRILFYIVVFGLIASAMAHLSTFVGINPEREFPAIWILHVLIIVIWIPVIVLFGRSQTKNEPKDTWTAVTGNAPRWMKVLAGTLFAYAFFNFFFTIFVLNEGGVPSIVHGQKVIHDHGNIIRVLTDEEYEKHRAYSVRTSSGHWMAFYAVAMMVLYTGIKNDSARKVAEKS